MTRRRSLDLIPLLLLLANASAQTSDTHFVRRSRDTLLLNDRPFYFFGTNAYYLLVQAARGDTGAVRDIFSTAASLGMSAVRTWAFHESPDSLDPTVIQYRPGAYGESALRGLDFVVHTARQQGMKLVMPFVGNWDDYGGMNQYVRWRAEVGDAVGRPGRYPESDMGDTVRGAGFRTYVKAISPQWAHDDFYVDPLIRTWFRNYVTMLLMRTNTFTGVRYKDDPTIMMWELANEPRSSDIGGNRVRAWVQEMAAFVKSIDSNHLVGTGEEGFDGSSSGYSTAAYNHQDWLFDGSQGVSFAQNTAVESVDIASIHLYPEYWNLPVGAGNSWVNDHIRIARSLAKPLILGEFGATISSRSSVYQSWTNTVLVEDGAGALVWHLVNPGVVDNSGLAIQCPDEQPTCLALSSIAASFSAKTLHGLSIPAGTSRLLPNYPNPFNTLTTLKYFLDRESIVDLGVWDVQGRKVATIVHGVQRPGDRLELFDAASLATGVYLCRLTVHDLNGTIVSTHAVRMVLLK